MPPVVKTSFSVSFDLLKAIAIIGTVLYFAFHTYTEAQNTSKITLSNQSAIMELTKSINDLTMKVTALTQEMHDLKEDRKK